MSKLLNGIKEQLNYTTTENGAVAVKSTKNHVVDLFAQIGAMRTRSDKDIANAFAAAFKEDKLLATKMAFYARDIRGGLGERNTFRAILKYLANEQLDVLLLNLDQIAEYGRWDDLFVLFGTPAETAMLTLIKKQIKEDMIAEYPTLLAKWMPSENASSKLSKDRAIKIAKFLDMTPRQYRKTLSMLRKQIDIVETKISSKEWQSVDYSKLPSKAAMQYRQAFLRHDAERYQAYLNELKKPADEREAGVKVNADTLFPYDIVKKVITDCKWGWGGGKRDGAYKNLYNAQWDALPNFLEDDDTDSICMVDTSGSMTCDNMTPIASAIALGIYAAQHNKGRFKNHFITFSSHPELVELTEDNLWDNICNIKSIVQNTNVEAAFDLILDTAIAEGLTQEDLPSRITIISDMEFDSATRPDWRDEFKPLKKEVLMKTIAKKYEAAGYTMPRLIFWNVCARNKQFPMTIEHGIQFVSGHSPAIFEAITKGQYLDPIGLVEQTLNKPRYDAIKVN